MKRTPLPPRTPKDRLEVIEQVLQQDGYAPEVLKALELFLEECDYLRGEIAQLKDRK